ncbi:Ankyrin repeat domain containing protein [Pandoravirus salinus]|uniref:Ankyrin repeat domain containing protein n=1 Tax=Pandoravirus salinus TaxID=1349410 RepID=S4VZ60_9VIRU|nr:ankyrin repeat domain [Pandoravirus salinus]AGO84791.1 Ankyrin repeat domain containing protein [Pandoravirus salinus]
MDDQGTAAPEHAERTATPSDGTITEASIEDLPAELVDAILCLVGTLPHVRVVCKSWRDTLDHLVVGGRCRRLASGDYLGLLARWNLKEMILWARDQGHPWDAKACAGAARGGHFDLLAWLREQGCPWDSRACTAAAKYGHVDLYRRLIADGCAWDRRTAANAARSGHTEIIASLLDRGAPRWPEVCAGAARGGRLDTLQWLHDRHYPLDVWVRVWASVRGDDHINAWACAHGCPDPDDRADKVWKTAIERGYPDVVLWLRANGHPWPKDACRRAARHGHRNVLLATKADDIVWDEYLCMEAAQQGDMDLVRWLRMHDCPWGVTTTRALARRGEIAPLNWAIAEGCPIDCTVMADAVCSGHLHVVEWLDHVGCPRDTHPGEWYCERAIEKKWPDLFRWLVDHGHPFRGTVFERAICTNQPRLVQHLLALGQTWPLDAIQIAIRSGSLDMFNYLLDNGSPSTNEDDTVKDIIRRGRLDMLKAWVAHGRRWNPKECYTYARLCMEYEVTEWIHKCARN